MTHLVLEAHKTISVRGWPVLPEIDQSFKRLGFVFLFEHKGLLQRASLAGKLQERWNEVPI